MIITECQEMQRIKKHELIPTVIDHIFSICKEDENFKLKDDAQLVEKKLNLIESKLVKQERLLEQSEKIKKEITEKTKSVDDESFKLKYRILESLGSEL